MTAIQTYFARARECMELAEKARGVDRDTLVQIAQAWLSLAESGVALVPADPAPCFAEPSQRQ